MGKGKGKKGAGGCPEGTQHPDGSRSTGVPRGAYRLRDDGKAQRVSSFDSSRPAAAGAASTAPGPHPRSTLPSPGGGAAGASSSATPGAQAPRTLSFAGAAGEPGGAAGESSSAAPAEQAPPTPSSAGAAGASSSAAPGTQVQPTSVGGSSDAAALLDSAYFGSWDADNSTGDAAAPSNPDVQPEETVHSCLRGA